MSKDRWNTCFQSISSREHFLRLPSNHTHFPFSYSPRQPFQRTSKCSSSRLSGLFFPLVHAQSNTAVSEKVPSSSVEIEAMTTIERMSMAPQNKVIVSHDDVKAFIESETATDRLKQMYTKNTLGEYSEDLQLIFQLTKNTSVMVFIFTSFLGGYAARDTYIRKNKHVQYETKFQAMRKYNDAVFFGSLRMGIKWAFKSAIFTGLFMLTAQSISVARNQTNVIEYIAAGGLTCALLRVDVGLKGMLAGGIIGSALGLLGGAGFCGLMYSANVTQQKRHYSQIEQRLRDLKEAQQLSPMNDSNILVKLEENQDSDKTVAIRSKLI